MVAVDFSPYLEFVRTSPRYHETLSRYTATDAIHLVLEAQTVVREEGEGREFREQKQQVERFPVLEGLRKYASHHVLLSGKPGSGKSTTLKRLLLEMAEAAKFVVGAKHLGDMLSEKPNFSYPNASPSQGLRIDSISPSASPSQNLPTNPISSSPEKMVWGEVKIPVLVQLKSNRPILEAIRAEFRQGKLSVSPGQIDDWLLEGKLFLLLDGVNEIPSEELRRELQVFREDNPHTPMIFTTRDLAVGGDLGIEKKLEMRPLTDSQMREFVGKYLPDYGNLLLRQLENRLREVAETPLLLKMLCEVFNPETRQIPKSKGELFRAFDRKYHQHKENPPVSGDFRRFQSEVLQCLAFEMMRGDREKPTEAWLRVSRPKAEGILESWLGKRGVVDAPTKAKEWLEDLLEHHLLQVAADGREIEFHHQLFQEYYAAEVLLVMVENRHPDVMDDGRLQHFYLNYLKWTEPVALMLGLLGDGLQAVRVVRLALAVDLLLGARLAGEVKLGFQGQTVGMVSRLEIPGWFKFKLWGITGSDVAIPGLLQALEDEDSDVHWRVVEALGKIGSQSAIIELLHTLEDEYSFVSVSVCESVRVSVVKALGDLGLETAIPGLLHALEDKYPLVRMSAAEALGKIGSPAAIPGLLHALEDKYPSVRVIAAEGLGRLGSQAAIPELLHALEDENFFVRMSAANGLGRLGSQAAIPELLHALEDKEFFVRMSAVNALEKLGSQAAIPGLLHVIENEDEEFFVRMSALSTLASGKLDSQVGIPELLHALKHENSDLLLSASIVLGQLDSQAGMPRLLHALKNENFNVRLSAALVLGKLGSQAAIPGLLTALEDEDFDVRWSAAGALGQIEQDKAAHILPHLLTLIPTKSGQHALRAIADIQKNCQFYNYEIFTARLPPVISPQQLTDNPVLNTLQQINQGVQKMSETPKQDFTSATFNAPVNFAPNQGSQDVQNIDKNYGTAINKQVQAPTEDIEKFISDFQQFILNLQQKYAPITDETAIAQIIDVEAKLLETQDKPRFANFLNLKRLWNGSKKAALKVGEHFVEENPWGKGAIAFLEGVSEEVEETK